MAHETSPTSVLELSAGDAACGVMRLYQGRTLDTIIVGSDADWCIQAKGVAARHAAFYFDGESLFVAALPREVVWVDNRRIGEEWQQIAAPAAIALGTALIQLSHFAPPSPPKREGRGESSAVLEIPFAAVGSSTLLESKPTLFFNMTELMGEKASPAPSGPSVKVQLALPRAVVALQPTPRRAITLPAILRRQQISWKVAAPALLLLVGAAFLMLAPAESESASASAGAQVRAPASAPSREKTSASTVARAEGSAPAEQRQTAVQDKGGQQAAPLIEQGPARVAAKSAMAAGQDGNAPAASAPQKGATLQRKAIDALISGNGKEARELYAALVTEQPSDVALREALRILRRAETDKAQGDDGARP